MSLRIRRGTEAQRLGQIFDMGELVVTTNEFKLFVGDGITAGGRNVAQNLAGQGMSFNATTGKLDIAPVTLTTDDIAEGVNRLYFTPDRAQDAVGEALAAGNEFNVGIQFTYDDLNARITAVVTPDGVGLMAVVDDTTPELGGDLSLNGNDITGTGNISIAGSITLDTGKLTLDGNTVTSNDTVEPVNTSNGATNDNLLYVGTTTSPATMWISSEQNFAVQTGLVGPDNDGTAVYFRTSRGTLASPTAILPGDRIAKNVAQAWDGEKYWHAGGYGIGVDPAETVSVGLIPGRFEAQTRGPDGFHSLFYTSRGVLTGAVLQPTSFADEAARDAALTPSVRQAGMICFVADSGGGPKFQGFNGTAWVDLG